MPLYEIMSLFKKTVDIEKILLYIVRVDARFEVGEVTESITISGAAPTLKTDKTDVSQTIGTHQVEIYQ